MLASIATTVLLASGVAWALEFTCSDGNPCSGTPGDDRIFGTPERDIILAKGGDDYIEAKEGDDEVRGASGAEFISGYEGDDLLIGHGGIDVISDQSFGNDVDTLRGGPQNDRLYSDDGDGFDFLQCGRGTSDQVTVDAGDTVSTNCETVEETPTSP